MHTVSEVHLRFSDHCSHGTVRSQGLETQLWLSVHRRHGTERKEMLCINACYLHLVLTVCAKLMTDIRT